MPGLLVANLKADGIYIVKTDILQNDSVLYHFPTYVQNYIDNSIDEFAITAHTDTQISYQVDNGNYNGTYKLWIDTINEAAPAGIATMGQMSYCLTLEFLEYE